MNLKDLNVSERISTDKTQPEILQLLTGYKDKRKIESTETGLIIYGLTFYNYEFLNKAPHWEIIVKPKKYILILSGIFLLGWALIAGIQTSWIFSIISLFFIIPIGGFIHKGLMTESIKELKELIKNKTGYNKA